MPTFRIALANIQYPATRDESVALAVEAIRHAADRHVRLVCFPECYVPGYRAPGKHVAPPDGAFLEHAWSTVARAAGSAHVGVVLGTERVTDAGLLISALVINPDGTRAGFQDKNQLDPSEEDGTYTVGRGRCMFALDELIFGVAICHEGFRYPETVRWAARQGAHVVFHPHFDETAPGAYRPTTFADPRNTFHEKAVLCRAAENTCFVASVNCASDGSPTTSAIARPDGSLLAYQPYGVRGLLVADLEIAEATGHLARRYMPLQF